MQLMLLVSAIAKILPCLLRFRLNTRIFLAFGHIGGNLDFLASTVAGDEDMRQDGDYALPEKPYFIVVEAKKAATLGQYSSKAQLLAELLTLEFLDG